MAKAQTYNMIRAIVGVKVWMSQGGIHGPIARGLLPHDLEERGVQGIAQ
jgi:hypothetical protein